jgi:hypothetical protein
MNPEAPFDGLNEHWEPPPEEPVLIWPMLLTLFVIVVIGFVVYSCSAGAHEVLFQHWQHPHYGCGQWTPCYVRALSREHMSGMPRIVSRSYWTTRR